jgi:hypothetical protein
MGFLDFLTGGGLGAVAGAVSGIAGKVIDLKLKKHELEQRAMDHAHELKLREADMAMATQEAQSRFRIVQADAEARVSVADLDALKASFGVDRAAYGDHALGRVVDFVRGVTRPLVTYAATAYVTYAGVTDPSVRPQCLFIASMAISWWFAARPGKLADFRR